MTALYRWPAAARFGRVVPKTKFYEHGNVKSAVRDRFVSDVRRITWAYKLAESTIKLPGTDEVPEIQVFEIDAKEQDIAESVLAAIDKAVRTPIIFEISRGAGPDEVTRMVAAHKQVGAGAPRLGPYFSTAWEPASSERATALPAAIDLTTLYVALLQPLTPVAARAGEGMAGVVARLTTIRALERDIAALERTIRNEPQLNRKVDLRRTLKTKQATLKELLSPTPSPAPGDPN